MKLIPIEVTGQPRETGLVLTEELAAVGVAMSASYERTGFVEPWIGYFGVREGEPVGVCGFKGPIADGEVEIAYFTCESQRGKGAASQMAERLVELALAHEAPPRVTAQTLPERNASHRILEKLGFEIVGTLEHPEDGTVAVWHYRSR